MMHRQYIVVFNPLDPRFDAAAIQNVIKADRTVTHWWNHLPNCFILTTSSGSDRLARGFRERAPGVGFLVTEIDLRNSDGALPNVSWEWIIEREKELTEAKEPASAA